MISHRWQLHSKCECYRERSEGETELRGRCETLAGPGLPDHLRDGEALHAAQEGRVLAVHAQLPPGFGQFCRWILNRWLFILRFLFQIKIYLF